MKKILAETENCVVDNDSSLTNAFVAARIESGLTQQKLSVLTGISQADISRLESGISNPSIKTLKRLAGAMGKKVKIDFI